MKQNTDKIQFESRAEVQEVLGVIEKYFDAYPKEKDNRILKELYGLLDVMDMCW